MTITRTITTDPRPQLAEAAATTADVIGQVRPDHLDRPTPCSEMNVGELLSHLLMAIGRTACAGRGDELATWPMAGPELAADEWAPAWREAAGASTAAWADADDRLDEEIALPWTVLAGADVVAIYVNEIVTHTWDLAAAIGVEAVWSDEVLAVASAAIHSELPDADRRPMWDAFAAQLPEGIPWADPFTNAVEVGDDATAVERLVAWNGRDPRWTPSA